MLFRSVDPAGVDGNGYTALHCAADMGEEDTIELLLTPEEEEDAALDSSASEDEDALENPFLGAAAGDASGGTPPAGAKVEVHYVGTLLSDGSKFDSSRDRPGNFKFVIGKGAVIKGWDTGVATMHKGEKAELFCRADYAYGEPGSPPKIPGGATLKFEVELLSWAEKEKERWELSAKEKIGRAHV